MAVSDIAQIAVSFIQFQCLLKIAQRLAGIAQHPVQVAEIINGTGNPAFIAGLIV